MNQCFLEDLDQKPINSRLKGVCLILERFEKINLEKFKKIIQILNNKINHVNVIILHNNLNFLNEKKQYLKKVYKNINFYKLKLTKIKKYYNLNDDITKSLNICSFLKKHNFEIICFYDSDYLGFWCIREKQTGRNFEKTTITRVNTECANKQKKHSLTDWAERQFIAGVDFVFDLNNLKDFKITNNKHFHINNKKISLCIPFYNQKQCLHKLIYNFENQTKTPDEIILVNDGSTDVDVLEELNSIKTKLNLKIFHTSNQGPAAAKNFATSKSLSEYIIFFDSDNIPSNNFIESLYNSINYSNYDVIFPSFHILKDGSISTTYIALGDYIQEAKNKNTIGDTCCIVKKTVAVNCPFITDRDVHEDWIWGIELNLKNYKISSIYEPLFYYVKNLNGKSNTVNKNLNKNKEYIVNIFKKHG